MKRYANIEADNKFPKPPQRSLTPSYQNLKKDPQEPVKNERYGQVSERGDYPDKFNFSIKNIDKIQ